MTRKPRVPRIKPKAGYHHGDLRQQLVIATRRLVDRDGAENFKIADASALANVSAPAVYRHFRDREAILEAVSDDGFERLAQQAGDAAGAFETGSIEAICAVGCAYIGFAQSHPNIFRLLFAPRDKQASDGVTTGPSSAGSAAYNVLLTQVAKHLQLDHENSQVLATALSLWMYVHGFASLQIDEKLGVGRMQVDVDMMVRANTLGMLGAFHQLN